jgi:hypothetical protein
MKMDHIRALAGVGVHRVTLPTFGLGGEQDVFAGLDKLGSFIVRCEEELS